MANPRLVRLVAWAGLEAGAGGVPRPAAKLARIAEAQAAGAVSDRFSPEFLLATITAVCEAWVPSNWYAGQIDPDAAARAARYREQVVRLVALMVRPEPPRRPARGGRRPS